ncbi:MAG: DUF302 domain-containing protein [Inquilinaceae bacterium]
MRNPLRLAMMLLALAALPALPRAETGELTAGPGWAVHRTGESFSGLVASLETAISAHNMGLVTAASASQGAKNQGFTIPGNRVVGVYRNDFARRMLEASVAAGIEAPIRFYVTENADGTATLSYKTPTAVFSPYFEEGGEPLRALAAELDGIFAAIAADAVDG